MALATLTGNLAGALDPPDAPLSAERWLEQVRGAVTAMTGIVAARDAVLAGPMTGRVPRWSTRSTCSA